MHITRRVGKGISSVFLLFVFAVVCLETTGLASAPTLSDLEVTSIASSSWDDAWVVELTVDVSHDTINEVSSLVVTAYDSATGSWDVHIVRVSIADPFQSFEGSTVYDYTLTLEIPKSDSGGITIEARAAHGDERGSTSWGGWIPQEPSHVFSGGLKFTDGTVPTAVGGFESSHWMLSVSACGIMTATLDTLDCHLLCADIGTEVPTWWRVWDTNCDNDGEPDPGELIDTGWIPVADFVAHWNKFKIVIPSGWSGEIAFQAKMERNGLADLAGSYSATLTVDVWKRFLSYSGNPAFSIRIQWLCSQRFRYRSSFSHRFANDDSRSYPRISVLYPRTA